MPGFYEIPINYENDLRNFAGALADGGAGKIDPVRFKARRPGISTRTPNRQFLRERSERLAAIFLGTGKCCIKCEPALSGSRLRTWLVRAESL